MILNLKYTKRDFFDFFGLYALAIITIYLLPDIIAYIYFLVILFMFWKSQKNVFWFILVFFMLDPPGGLFPDDWNYGLPIIPKLNIRFIELFAVIAFFKALKLRKIYIFKTTYLNNFKFLLFTLFILIVYTVGSGISILSLFIVFKALFIWSLIYSITILINSRIEWLFFFKIIFVLGFISLGLQILALVLRFPPADLLGSNFNPIMDYGNGIRKVKVIIDQNSLMRPIGSSFITLTAYTGAMFFLKNKMNGFKINYLYLIIFSAYISIFITATRGWFIAFTLVLILFFLSLGSIKKYVSVILITILMLFILLSIPLIRSQFNNVLDRLFTLEAVAQGDVSADGTNERGDYAIHLFNLWKDRPIFGWGFTDSFKANQNGHAGLANLLFNVGIFGVISFIVFWIALFYKPLMINRRISELNPYKGSLIVFTFTFLVYFIVNATSGQQFGFYLGFGPIVLSQILFYGYSSFFIIDAIREENKLKIN